ncbi:nuclease-related domain-containing protein [Marinagarivorans cellulosilyticus]|uniref:NERD domain-containing protein n=1 Tax=Marinagarivorans cellulosilyticus TaxID=2721545 RepID=A0AAN1WJV5_9GAMM|nr:NERD domain-containing protein [Marinagarivorans cellulosilyticus]BCD98862.1 hypothetical protein MARGE09_P3063 [Marinagarivorans cellulosilyticus]
MDFSPILSQIYSSLWYLIPFFVLVGVVKSPWFKGVFGEFQVNMLLKLFLSKDDYHLIKNVTLRTEDGTTQIDHILVSKYGVFVLETKNMKGWIFGSISQKSWTQKIYRHTSKFQNPLHQNYKHTKTLEEILKVDPGYIHSVIVFIGDNTFKTEMPENVTYARGCIEFIKSKQIEVFESSQVIAIVNEIESGRLKRGITTNRDHVAHVRTIVQSKEDSTAGPTNCCPKCGSAMIVRESKRGENVGRKFWGCSSFPRCRSVLAYE